MTLIERQNLFATLVCRLIEKAQSMGFLVTLGEAWRPQFACEWYAAHGFGITHSLHEKRLAIDLNLFRDAQYLTTADAYRPLGEYWKSLSGPEVKLVWGGDFKDEQGNPRPDADHFSMALNGVE